MVSLYSAVFTLTVCSFCSGLNEEPREDWAQGLSGEGDQA